MWARVWAFTLGLSIVGCTSEDSANVATNGRISPTYAGPAELTYCTSPIAYGMPKVTISGNAKYTRRNPWGVVGVGSGGLGGALTTSTHPATLHNIRRAEIRVTDGAGNVVQCGETDGSGNFSLELPQGNVAYTLSINSRANNSYLRASILNRPEQNLVYGLQSSVNASNNTAGLQLTASAHTNGVLGAAFNILDQFLNANDYLRTQVGNCSVSFAGCPDFTVAPKVVAYWELGYNPNGYFGSNSGLSFYLPGYSRLFILGGLNGDVNNTDTDHFDNSVILHEYGHFLEDAVFESDSPGGSHNGNAIIDPRLAWSEGWGNFFQAAVRYAAGETNPRYTDTQGNDDGDTALFFDVDLEDEQIGTDVVTALGEGNFREFSVTRFLWDIIDTVSDTAHGSTETTSGDFPELWAALTKSSNGFNDTDWAFRSIGHLHYGQSLLGASNWSTARATNRHIGDTSEYAQWVTTAGTCSYIAAAGAIPANTYTRTLTPTATGSDLFRNYDFFHIRATTTGSYTFRLDYQDTNAVGVEADLDLYLYNEDAEIGDSSSVLTYSRATPDGNVNTAQSEQFTINLTANTHYLLVVTAYVGSATGTAAHYSIKQGGAQLCPATL